MNGDVTLADDEETILKDTAAGSGLRPAPFFRLLLSIEYVFAGHGAMTIFSGRRAQTGATVFIRMMTDQVTLYLSTLTPEELARQFASGSGRALGDQGTNTWARHFYLDVGDFWRSMDVWGSAIMLFFRPPLAPPGGGRNPDRP